MSMPSIPNINPNISIIRDDALNIIVASIAMEELAIAHILNAEGEKLQYVLGTLEGKDPGEVSICNIMEVNNSVHKTLRNVIKQEMLLQLKLEDIIALSENGSECQLTIRGQKVWRDGNNIANTRPATVVINLLRDGEVYRSTPIDSTGDGAYTFECLPVWRDSYNKYNYQIDEVEPVGYTKTINSYNITNTVERGSIPISGTITWDDYDDNRQERPVSTTVSLLRNGVATGDTVTVENPTPPENTVSFNFLNVPQFDEQGVPYAYTVDIANVVNYRKTVNGYDIANAIELRTIAGTKTWLNDTEAVRPDDINVHLYQNGVTTAFRTVQVASPTVPENTAPFSFEDIPRFNAQGVEHGYTVDEDPVTDYAKEISVVGYDITNTYQEP